MAGRIPPAFIDELLNRVDIVDLINGRISLKKAGKDYQACCPFHDEKTPSFSVSRDKQFYHCFGCGVHGSAIGFLMEYDNMSFVEAVEELAQQAGVEVPREGGDKPQGPDPRPIYETLEQAAKFYAWQLRDHETAQRAVDYLKGRGLSGEIASTFNIGYAPPGWDNLVRQLGRDKSGLERLKKAGLTSESGDRCYDRLRDRIIFPIRDHRGRTIGFGGRVLGDEKPKYLNSPETPVFHKGRELYGLYEARKALHHLKRLLVVEGYMDVVALAQFGIRYAVATLGTATTPEHLEKLFRTAPEVVFCFDGDRAGREAGWKALNTTLPLMSEGREARFLFLPDGEDPDSLIRQEGNEAFEARIANATPLSRFLFDRLTEQVDMGSLDGRARLAELAKPLLALLPQGVFREMMYRELGEQVKLDPQRLGGQAPQRDRRSRTTAKQQPLRAMTPMQKTIALVMQHPEIVQEANLPTGWQNLNLPGAALLQELLAFLLSRPMLTPDTLLERWRGREEYRYLMKLHAQDLALSADTAASELRDSLLCLEKQSLEKELEQLLLKAGQNDVTSTEKQRLNQLLQMKRRL
jgi:DNA primase